MTSDRSECEQVGRVEAAAATLCAIADCLVEGAQSPAAFGRALGVLSDELAVLSKEVCGSSPPASGDGPRMAERPPAPTVGA
jgi:hypothetical protein